MHKVARCWVSKLALKQSPDPTLQMSDGFSFVFENLFPDPLLACADQPRNRKTHLLDRRSGKSRQKMKSQNPLMVRSKGGLECKWEVWSAKWWRNHQKRCTVCHAGAKREDKCFHEDNTPLWLEPHAFVTACERRWQDKLWSTAREKSRVRERDTACGFGVLCTSTRWSWSIQPLRLRRTLKFRAWLPSLCRILDFIPQVDELQDLDCHWSSMLWEWAKKKKPKLRCDTDGTSMWRDQRVAVWFGMC